jgi:glutamine synthetase
VVIRLETYRTIPWENDLPFFLGQFVKPTGKPLEICPAQLLQSVIARAKKAGFTAQFSQEFEWFNFSESPETFAQKEGRGLTPLTPGMFGYSILRSTEKNTYLTSLFSALSAFQVPIEGLHTETGPGVYEAAIRYSDVLTAADRAVLFKTSVKEIARLHGVMATFMAKISEHLPGCSGHVHQSLWDASGKQNLFYDAKDKSHMSALMKSYIAGQLYCLPHILPLVAPTINSYKRLVEGAWAPTTVTWGIDNRTVALRALPGSSSSCRLETRVVGSDTNPYLAMAACLAAGLYGIQHRMKLSQPASVGNGYQDISNGRFPNSLAAATAIMKESSVAKELLGKTFVQHFTETREWEVKQFAKSVTDWETRRYFEII